jgi:hypothetical protein
MAKFPVTVMFNITTALEARINILLPNTLETTFRNEKSQAILGKA